MQPLRVLIVEDSEDDCLLLVRELRRGGYEPTYQRVETATTLWAALDQPWDLLVADYPLPQFSGLAALELTAKKRPHLPVIVMSGTVGEEAAVGAIKAGASDFILKDHLIRLAPAVERGLREAQNRREHLRALQALRDSEDRYQAALQGSADGIWDRDLRNGRVSFSDQWKRMLGYEPHEIAHDLKEFDRRLHPEDRDRVWAAIEDHLRGATGCYTAEFRMRHKDGSWRWIQSRGAVLRDATGSPYRLAGSHRDVTEWKLAEETLRAREASLAAVQRIAQLGSWEAVIINPENLDENTLRWSDEVFRIFGRESGATEVSWRTFFEAVHPLDRERVAAAVAQAVQQGTSYDIEHRIVRPDGTERIVQERAEVVRDGGPGQSLKLLGTVQDITEHRRSEAKLREQAAWLDMAHDAICLCDLGQRLLYWNQGAERLYGWSSAEAATKTVRELLFAPEVGLPAEAWEKVLAQGSWEGDLRQVTRDGRPVEVVGRWTLVRDEAGNPKSVLMMGSDVTEKKVLERQFLRAQRLESVGQLAGGIAHDLNNVLTPIQVALPLLQEELRSETGLSLVQTLQTCVRRGADLIRQILTFSRGMSGEKVPLPPRHLLREMAKIIAETFPKSIRLKVAIPSDLWPVNGDATQLHQLLMNLCVNARDAMPEGGVLTLAAENLCLDENISQMTPGAQPGPYVLLLVSDTGTGILPELLDRIFDPFFTTKDSKKGTGLGLSTALGIAKGHGGFIQVQSKVGQGTQFKVYLPALGAQVVPPSTTSARPHIKGQGELILVVDDEAIIRTAVRKTLERHGYRVLTASDGTEGLALYARNREAVAAVLTDLLMPFMDGAALVQALVRMEPKVKVLAMSTRGLTPEAEDPQELKVHGFLPKPFSGEQLLTALRQVLDPQSSGPTP